MVENKRTEESRPGYNIYYISPRYGDNLEEELNKFRNRGERLFTVLESSPGDDDYYNFVVITYKRRGLWEIIKRGLSW